LVCLEVGELQAELLFNSIIEPCFRYKALPRHYGCGFLQTSHQLNWYLCYLCALILRDSSHNFWFDSVISELILQLNSNVYLVIGKLPVWMALAQGVVSGLFVYSEVIWSLCTQSDGCVCF